MAASGTFRVSLPSHRSSISINTCATPSSWTIVYDTIYACQDREDDRKVGVKSTALLFGDRVREILSLMVGALLVSLVYAGWATRQGAGYALLSCGGTLAHSVWQLATWNEADLKDHRAKFEVRSLPFARL